MAESFNPAVALTVTEMWSPQAQQSSTSGAEGRSRRRRGFQVTGPATTTTADVISDANIPKQGQPDPLNNFRLCMNVDVQRVAPILWLVIAEYEAGYVRGIAPGEDSLDLLATPPRYRGGFTRSVEAVDADLDGNPYQNVNAEPFDPAPQREILDPAIFVTRYEADIPFASSLFYGDTTNSTAFTLQGVAVPIGAACLYDMQYADEIAADATGTKQRFWEVSYEIRFRLSIAPDVPEGKAWWRRSQNRGFYERAAAPSPELYRLQKIKTGKDLNADPPVAGEDLVEPVPLSAVGVPLTFTNPPASPHWLYFKEKREADWTPLGLFT